MRAVYYVHARSRTEVHFDGTVVWSSDESLVRMFARAVAVDGGLPGGKGDRVSIIWTESDVHDHGALVRVTYGNLQVTTS